MGSIDGNLYVKGHLTADTMTVPAGAVSNASIAGDAAVARSKLAQDTLQAYPVNLTDLRVWDAMATVLPGTSSADDLGLYGGTFGTDSPSVRTYDVKTAGALTLRARFLVALPAEYDDGETVNIRVSAGMVTTVADSSCTVDIECYESDKELSIGADLCTTAAQDMNSLTFDTYDFAITAAGLVSGDVLDVRVSIAVNDGASGTTVQAAIGSIELLCDVRG